MRRMRGGRGVVWKSEGVCGKEFVECTISDLRGGLCSGIANFVKYK